MTMRVTGASVGFSFGTQFFMSLSFGLIQV